MKVPTTETRISEVRTLDGLRFLVATGPEANDPISLSLAAGEHPPEYRELLGLLRTVAPAGGRVLDLGAHLGSFTLGAPAAGFEVVAVEASPRNAALLRASVAVNADGRTRIVHAAVADRAGTLCFEAAGPYVHVSKSPGTAGRVEVPAVAVDDLLAEVGWGRVDFIKMDVEGSEVAAVRGMAKLLARADAPPICYESNAHTLHFFGQTPRDLKATVEALGYRNFGVDGERLVPVTAAEFQAETVVDYLG